MKKVSVIVPVYNTSKYLKRCLDSLVNQTLSDIEIIIINDCSTDLSKDILNVYEEQYKDKFKVIHNKTNMGIGYNRNLGIKKASGEFVAFIDSDDFIDETAFDKMYKKAIKENLDLVLCNFHKMLETKNGLIEIEPDFIIPDFKPTTLKKRPSLLMEVNLAPWNKLYRKDLFTQDLIFPENLKYEDAVVVVKVMARAKKIGIVNEKLNFYLVRSKSETTVMDKRVFDIIDVTKMIVKELTSQNYYSDIYESVEAFVTRNLFRYTMQQKNQHDRSLRNQFIEEVFDYLNSEFPNWKHNRIWKKRSNFKRMIESNKLLTKTYCTIFKA